MITTYTDFEEEPNSLLFKVKTYYS